MTEGILCSGSCSIYPREGIPCSNFGVFMGPGGVTTDMRRYRSEDSARTTLGLTDQYGKGQVFSRCGACDVAGAYIRSKGGTRFQNELHPVTPANHSAANCYYRNGEGEFRIHGGVCEQIS